MMSINNFSAVEIKLMAFVLAMLSQSRGRVRFFQVDSRCAVIMLPESRLQFTGSFTDICRFAILAINFINYIRNFSMGTLSFCLQKYAPALLSGLLGNAYLGHEIFNLSPTTLHQNQLRNPSNTRTIYINIFNFLIVVYELLKIDQKFDLDSS